MNEYSRYDLFFDEKKKTTSGEELSLFLENPLWKELNNYLDGSCGCKPEISYNLYTEQRCWNVEYHRSGCTLCTLFPEKNYFIAMVVLNSSDEQQANELLPKLTEYVRGLYNSTCRTPLGRWLLIRVTDRKILSDVVSLLHVKIESCPSD